MQQKNNFVTTGELAKILGISRIAVFKKVTSGKIHAVRIGRNFVIARKDLAGIVGNTLSSRDKAEIDGSVKKTVAEYGETLRLLGQE